ncbi:hypothetical protein FZI91_20030 [Mycobacterium sp. CBMA271]|uniref:hypothetical protein n=1 Tax=unclassified Mycobacteroides TaxID=2618759 RepID=UPI0012DF72C1|nr:MULTISPECIES: hypothetical protein [unclassified Mycobacteroides]MUM23976.1 hypothetical protein [Mycobacteroides sp. CBMA 271]
MAPLPDLNKDTLYLEGQVAAQVATRFKAAATQLEDELRQTVIKYKTNLGIGPYDEGTSWNTAVDQVVRTDAKASVLKVVETCMRRLNEFAAQADNAQKSFNELEDANKERIRKSAQGVDPSKSFPSYQ